MPSYVKEWSSGVTSATSQVNLLTHVGQTTATPSQSIFRFDPATRRFDAGNVDSYYQIQLGARYSFYTLMLPFLYVFVLSWQNLYALITIRNNQWGTR